MNYFVTFFTENLRGITTETSLECFNKQFERKVDAIAYFEEWFDYLNKAPKKEIFSLATTDDVSHIIIDVRNEDDTFCKQSIVVLQ